jgi:hypothetical protein
MGNNLCANKRDIRVDIHTEISNTIVMDTSPNNKRNNDFKTQEEGHGNDDGHGHTHAHDHEHDEISHKFSNDENEKKICQIQSSWRKKKEKNAVVERIKILESNLEKMGKYISVETMKMNISPAILEKESKLAEFKGKPSDRAAISTHLIFRRPFQFNYDNSVYFGNWNDEGLREGYGVSILEDKTKMEGLWIKGKLFKGRLFKIDGSYYEGDIQGAEAHGTGTFYAANGDKYIGSWKNGSQYLHGERIYNDHFKYEGMFNDGLFHGTGRYIFPDNAIYEGNFEKFSFKGHGKFKNSQGEIFEGMWANNFPNGRGTYIFAGKNIGKKYFGCYKNGKRDGTGKFTFRDDTYYDGQWQNGLPHGQGEYKVKNVTYKGLFRFGKLVQLDNGDNLKEDVSIDACKENFKSKSELNHLVDQVEGEVIGSECNTKCKDPKSFKVTYGTELLNLFARNHIAKIVEHSVVAENKM